MEGLRQVNKEMKGFISAELVNYQTLDDFCEEYIPNYNKERFQAIALRLFVAKETVITVFAVDKTKPQDAIEEALPVKKFKIVDVSNSALFSYISAFNCTLSTGEYDIDKMEVTNK